MTTFDNALDHYLGPETPFYFGDHLVMNLYGCQPEKIQVETSLRVYLREVVTLLDMKPFGPPFIKHFGHDSPITSGFTAAQPIETSLISGHFSDAKLSAYIDLLSCKPYNLKLAREHAAEFFGAEHVIYWELSR